MNGCCRNTPTIWNFKETRILANQQRTATRTLCIFATGFEIVFGIIRENNDANTVILFARTGSPVECCMKCIDCTDASKGHVNNIAVSETVISKTVLIALCKHIENVCSGWFRTIQCRFSTQIHPTNIPRIDAISIDKTHDGHSTHRCSIFVNIRDGHGLQAQPFVQFSIVCPAHFCEVTHVHVQARKMNCHIVNPNVDHTLPPNFAYL